MEAIVWSLTLHMRDDILDHGLPVSGFCLGRCSDVPVGSKSLPIVEPCSGRVSLETLESHGCAEYQGCDPAAPVVWCEHSEGGYDGSTHGWPLFGGDRIWSFVSQL
jgi:hypothetical protein